MKRPNSFLIFWMFLVITAGCLSVVFFLLGFLPFETLKSFGDSLSKDGNFERLTLSLFQQVRFPVVLIGSILFLFSTWSLFRTKQSQSILAKLLSNFRYFIKKLWSDTFKWIGDIRRFSITTQDLVILGSIVVFAAFARIVLIDRTMDYDEAYTFMEFARHSFRHVISDYHVPNNHVFHTLLVRLSYLAFGDSPWAIRIPVFLAGVALVPVVYLLGRKMYNSSTGLLAAGLVAGAPVLITYSITARGYPFICLFTLILLLLSLYVKQKRNTAAWLGMAVVTAFGFYTIPIMLHPFLIISAWLFFSGLVNDISSEYGGFKSWFVHLVSYSFASAGLIIFLYAPIFKANGILTFFHGNQVVNPMPMDVFIGKLPNLIHVVFRDWLSGNVPAWAAVILMAGVVLSFLLHRKITTLRVPIQLPLLVVLILVLLIQRPLIMARIWLFLLPFFILWSAAGLVGLLQMLPTRLRHLQDIPRFTTLTILLIIAIGSIRFLLPFINQPEIKHYPPFFDSELVSQYLKSNLRDGDVVVVTEDDDAFYWYYAHYYRIPEVHIRGIKSRPFKRALIISHPQYRWSIKDTISRFGPDYVFFDQSTLKEVTQIRNTIIYEIYPYDGIVNKAYGLPPED
jgi:hypothetical protein